ncbi:MAG: MBL fold metallo-hydrolase [Peptococcaceae bacterium]|nr:MBL fold metallo-hydrolase [Peptococcaceae bacterium]
MMVNRENFKPVEEIRILSLIDNYFDGLLPSGRRVFRRRGLGGPPGPVVRPLPPPLTAEHGLSLYIEVRTGGEIHSLLLDFGGSPDGVVRNVAPLQLDLSRVEALVLSHGHFDHFGGMESLVRSFIPAERMPLPLYAGREAFARRFLANPNGVVVDLGALQEEKVAALGLQVKEVEAPTAILPGVLLTGEVPRVTPFEQGSPLMEVERNGNREKDLFPGELSLVFHLDGRGLVVVSACAHAGIVNTVRRAVEITGVEKVHAVLGGFHLSGAPEEKIGRTVAALQEFGADLVVPMHCTGFPATKLIAEQMAASFVLYSVGTEYRLRADD